MNWFPQIGAGTLVQFPLRRKRMWRTISNDLENGERILLPDGASGQVEWGLSYVDLSDTEAENLRSLFASMRGQWGSFGFVDPLANLLAWSEDLSRPDWQLGLLSKSPGASDPAGGQNAWTLSNGSAGEQSLNQSLELPGEYVTCFSAWVRADTAGPVSLVRDGVRSTATVGPAWKRMYVTGAGTAGSSVSSFSVALAAGQTAQVFGLQVEAQPFPSQYKPASAAAGIYPETSFGSDELTFTHTGPGLSACAVKLLSRVPTT